MLGSGLALEDLPLPRRVAIARALTDALDTERELAALYAAFAARTPLAALGAALTELAQAKVARVALLEGLIGASGSTPRAPLDPSRVAERADFFARAFQAERALEVGYRELGALLAESMNPPGLRELVADAARHRELIRQLYVRYS